MIRLLHNVSFDIKITVYVSFNMHIFCIENQLINVGTDEIQQYFSTERR
jgi:hypothetical protein